MRKSCKNCRNYNWGEGYCLEKQAKIIDKTAASYCKSYYEKRNLPKGEVKCVKCININKYGWCCVKRKCFDETERIKTRRCINFKEKKSKFVKKLASKK